jgi:hypothetical protein
MWWYLIISLARMCGLPKSCAYHRDLLKTQNVPAIHMLNLAKRTLRIDRESCREFARTILCGRQDLVYFFLCRQGLQVAIWVQSHRRTFESMHEITSRRLTALGAQGGGKCSKGYSLYRRMAFGEALKKTHELCNPISPFISAEGEQAGTGEGMVHGCTYLPCLSGLRGPLESNADSHNRHRL